MIALPDAIAERISQEAYTLDTIGQSGSSVCMFRDKVLKIQPQRKDARREAAMLNWLQGKLPVPRILAHEVTEAQDFLLMSRISGRMACDPYWMEQPQALTRQLAKGLKQLWQVDISRCPADQSPASKLADAQRQVDFGLVDLDNVQPDTFGDGGFRDPGELLQWLKDHKPEYVPVLSHGDFCLPNVFFGDDGSVAYIDLGRSGVGDKWCDIALCWRSLRDNFSGIYDGTVYPGYDPMMLFEALELEPDWEKIRYYILMDELF